MRGLNEEVSFKKKRKLASVHAQEYQYSHSNKRVDKIGVSENAPPDKSVASGDNDVYVTVNKESEEITKVVQPGGSFVSFLYYLFCTN